MAFRCCLFFSACRIGFRREVRGRGGGQLLVALLAFAVLPSAGYAQSGFVVDGRVVEAGGRGIGNAIVELDGSRPILTSSEGLFRFEGVERGGHTLRVEAFGYASTARSLAVSGDTTVTVVVDVAPFVLDSLVVAPKKVDFTGQVRGFEGGHAVAVADADVATNQGHTTRTNNRGGFELDAWEAVPVLLRIRAFGYLPLDTVLVPAEHQKYSLFLETDSLVERMVATEVRRIERRGKGRVAVTMRPMNRQDLLRRGTETLADILKFDYPGRATRVRCVVFNERALTPSMGDGFLETTLARDVQRIEFLFRGAMLRVYTRDFMRRMLGGGIELREPVYVEFAHPPLCK